ncbi:hypothetical protein MG5_04031 [Candida albicans P57072]|nr:hypothetical protein MG5_04031 [Candida albicans P57072]KHC33292.1 hypothetical protein MGO_03993 [Candida albicans P76055]KHC49323.1 hypothetical protein MEW_03942 [Candida albicans P60002]KHC73941.1 hypothetical protein MGS_04036 [Candida albicans P78042]
MHPVIFKLIVIYHINCNQSMGIETSLTPENSTIITYNLQNSHFFFLSYSRLIFISSGFFTTVKRIKFLCTIRDNRMEIVEEKGIRGTLLTVFCTVHRSLI